MTTPVPGPPAAVLSAVLSGSSAPPAGRAVFSSSNTPDLPSLQTEVVWLPEFAELQANVQVVGTLISQGWATGNVTAVTGSYTPLPTDAVILANATSGALTITLPDATQQGFFTGQRFSVIKTDSSANAVTITGSAGQLISGSVSISLGSTNGYTGLVFDGANWWVWTGFTTGAGGSPSGPAGGSLTGTYPNPGLVSATTSTRGGVILDGTASDIQPTGTAAAAGSTTKAADAGHVHPEQVWLPADAGLLGWAFDPGPMMIAGFGSTSGTIYLIRVNVRASISVTNVILFLQTVGATLTAGDSFAGLYAGQTAGGFTAGQRIGVTADQSTAWSTAGNANTYQTMALTGGPFTVPAGFCWVAVCSTGTTAPTWGRGANFNNIASNSGLAAATARFATNGTGTSLPTSITPSSNTLSQQAIWAGIS